MKLVALISDTHGLVPDEEVLAAFEGCSLVLHAGDVGHHGGHQAVLDALMALPSSPEVKAVRGNVDDVPDAAHLPGRVVVPVPGTSWLVLMQHIIGPKDTAHVLKAAQEAGAQIVVCGHSHIYSTQVHEGVRFVNPGSAGPRRFKLKRTCALLHLPEDDDDQQQPWVECIPLADKPAKAQAAAHKPRKRRRDVA